MKDHKYEDEIIDVFSILDIIWDIIKEIKDPEYPYTL